jgi:predicted RNase H-like HicB family nuclease
MRHYIALIHKDANSDYGVSFPDLPGVISAGSTLDEAHAMAAEALAFHLEGLAEDGETVPEPSTLEEIMAIAERKDGAVLTQGYNFSESGDDRSLPGGDPHGIA